MKILVFAALVCLAVGEMGATTAAAKQGSSREAEAMVKRAVALVASVGSEAAFAEINNPTGPFVDGDLYLFVIDTKGTTLAHGFNKQLIGKNMLELRDPRGRFFIKEFIALAETKGQGWVDYEFTNPLTKKIEKKSTFVEKHGDLILGCGIYKP